MKKSYIMIAAVAVLAVGCHNNKKESAEALMPVEVTPVVTDSITLYKNYPGTLTADRTIPVVARVNGTIVSMPYTAGAYVHQGDVLFTIDPVTYRNAVTEAEASLASARSQNVYAEGHYEAVLRASKSNAVSQMEVAQALTARDQSRSAVRNAEAQLSTARTNLGHCTITAPCSGHVSINEKSRGAYVSGEGSPVVLATVYDDAILQANFAIEDASFQRMFLNPNNRDLIDYKSIPLIFSEKLPHEYTADLIYLAPDVDASTGTLSLVANVDNKYNELKAGMYVTVRLPYKVDPQAMLIRDASIGTDQLGKYVYVVNDSDKVVYTPIKTGDLVADTMRVVSSGLRPGQRYVTAAMLKVRDGMTVKPYLQGSQRPQSDK